MQVSRGFQVRHLGSEQRRLRAHGPGASKACATPRGQTGFEANSRGTLGLSGWDAGAVPKVFNRAQELSRRRGDLTLTPCRVSNPSFASGVPGGPVAGSRSRRSPASRSKQASVDCTRSTPIVFRKVGGGGCVCRKIAMVRAGESIATSTQFSGLSSTTMSSASAAAMSPREPVTTNTLGRGKPFEASHRCDWICDVAPAVVGRLVRKMISQRRSVASAESRATTPGSVSSRCSQNPSIPRMRRQRRRCWRSVRRRRRRSGVLPETASGATLACASASRPGSGALGAGPKS